VKKNNCPGAFITGKVGTLKRDGCVLETGLILETGLVFFDHLLGWVYFRDWA
jgi:hypothetical protein